MELIHTPKAQCFSSNRVNMSFPIERQQNLLINSQQNNSINIYKAGKVHKSIDSIIKPKLF